MANILLGVSSSISIYKALELVSKFKKAGHEVYPILTENAAKMISPRLFYTLAGHAVENDMFEAASQGEMNHIHLAKKAELILLYPVTANLLAKVAHGFADDLLTTTILAAQAPVLFAPAMNPTMWAQKVVQANVEKCQQLGYTLIKPDEGLVACGDYGSGKLASPERVFDWVQKKLNQDLVVTQGPKRFVGKKFLVTGGGSREPIDPVRVITNLSSGKMAKALVTQLVAEGAQVTYMVGNTQESLPEGARLIHFETALDLQKLLENEIGQQDVLIMAAAPGDFRVKEYSEKKLSREKALTLELMPNPDILQALPKVKGQLFVGFAAEVGELETRAREKLLKKNLDLIVANKAVATTKEGHKIGMEANLTELLILNATGIVEPQVLLTKAEAASRIIDQVYQLLK